MRNIFHIAAELELQRKPKWLDGFRAKFDLPYHYHITVKQKTRFKRGDIELIKKDLENIAKKYGVVARINGLNKHKIKAGHDKNHQILRMNN